METVGRSCTPQFSRPSNAQRTALRLIARAALVFLATALLLSAPLHAEDRAATGLDDQLRSLSAQQGFRVLGLRHVSGATTKPVGGGVGSVEALRVMLHGYDYVVVNAPEGRIAEVRILGRSQIAAQRSRPRRVVVSSVRRAGHHDLVAVLAGPNGVPHETTLTLDTGATTIVLPASMIANLGFRPEELRLGRAETAGGPVRIWSGELAFLAVGEALVKDVAVSFIDDGALGAKGLLGMSFLRRFKLIVDDEANEVVFLAR